MNATQLHRGVLMLVLIFCLSCGQDTQHHDETDMSWRVGEDAGGEEEGSSEDQQADSSTEDANEDADEGVDLSEDMTVSWETPEGMVNVPEGAFTMGSDRSGSALFGEYPPHQVVLSRYAIDRTEVTTVDYTKCVEDGACGEPSTMVPGILDEPEWCNYGREDKGDHPINCVMFEQANAYCQWAGMDLPTEAQFEKAARGPGEGRTYSWGEEEPSCELVAAQGCKEENGTWGAGEHPGDVSSYGIRDLIGNVQEWTRTFNYAYEKEEGVVVYDPVGPSSGERRMVRGSSIRDIPFYIEPAFAREPFLDEAFGSFLGFRCAYNGPNE